MQIVRHAWLLLLVSAIGACGLESAPRGMVARGRPAAAVDQARLAAAEREPQNWLVHGGTSAEQRFSALDQINERTIRTLGLAWSYEFDTNRGQEATPLVVDGVMYVSSAWSKVFALDARTGQELWTFDPKVPGEWGVFGCCDVVNRGVAVWQGKVFVGTFDGRLISLDARTGRPIWSEQTTDKSKAYTITGAPRVFKDKVVIGNGGAEFGGTRGYVTAYDPQTGKQIWRFYTVPADPAKGPEGAASDSVMPMAAKTWAGKWYDFGGGGTVWDAIVYDRELDQLYIGVGNGSPWNRAVRSDGKGDNLFLGSIVALDPDTGAYRWHYQASPGDSWDFTSSQQMTLATLNIDGKPRKVLRQPPKNGFFYVLDRTTGKLISANNFVPVTWADHIDIASGRPVLAANAYYDQGPFLMMPSSLGGHNWHPMSFSPRTGLVYIPTMQRPTIYAPDPGFHFIARRWALGQTRPAVPTIKVPPASGALIAWDPVHQREVWRVPQVDMWNGGALSTAGNLVFAGNALGLFEAFRATDGARLWHFQAQSAIMAGPISYSVDGVQYVAVLSGKGGSGPLSTKTVGEPQKRSPPGRVLVFRIGGSASLPPFDFTMPPANPPDETFSREQVTQGQTLYYWNCLVCHGGSVLPDLRRSGVLTNKALWQSVVHDGALSSRGMASFAPWLKPDQIEAIRAYVGGEAATLQRKEGGEKTR